MTAPTPARRVRHFTDCAAVHLDAGALVAEPPRFVLVDTREWPGFRLEQIAAGVFTLVTEDGV